MIVAWKKTKTKTRTRTKTKTKTKTRTRTSTRTKYENKTKTMKFDHRIIVIKEITVFVRLRYFKFEDANNNLPVISIKVKE